MSHIKYILYDKANPAAKSYQHIRSASVFLCLMSLVSTVHAQSEFLFRDQNAVSVGAGVSKSLNDSVGLEGINQSLGFAVTSEGVLDAGVTFSKNSQRSQGVTSFFAGVNLGISKRKLQRNGVILFGAIAQRGRYLFGARLYHRQNTSKTFFLVPQAEGGVISFRTGRSSRDSRLFWSIGLSLGFGSGKSPLFVIAPGFSKVQETPMRLGVTATLVVQFPNKPFKKKR